MQAKKSGRWRLLLALAVCLAIVVALHPFWLPSLGYLLVSSEPPRKADLVIVLAGDWLGNRIVTAGELARAGYAPKVLVSSPTLLYGVPEGELAIRHAISRGLDAAYFDLVPVRGNSTRSEAVELLAEARRRRARKLLIVTSNFHTRRSRGIYEDLRGDLEIHVTAAAHPFFQPDQWWKTRESRKTWLLEFTKLVTGAFGI